MKTASIVTFFVLVCSACSSSPPPQAASACNDSTGPACAETAATQPSSEKLKSHLAQHVEYPATRAQILAACAETPEFSAAEKRWLSEHLADGTYASATDAIAALGQ